MKKFFNDNLWWMVIIAIAVGGYALYRTFGKKETSESVTVEAVKTDVAE